MKQIPVSLSAHSYSIYIGEGLLGEKYLLEKCISSKQIMVVSNTTIAPLYLERVTQSLADFNAETFILPDGEQYKTLDTINQIITELLCKRFSRDSCLLALGGGVVGDITGFAAACYQRGVDFVQLPTTLLAQVDAAVGGKTGVNHDMGKNMIGAFHQPRAVIADTSTLSTLPAREVRAGLAEVIKYGLIRDTEFFYWLEDNITRLLELEPTVLARVIERSCVNKAEIVSQDEKERGSRALLNLGHTFGHAIETGLAYKGWLHGEAVALGMLIAAELSHRLGWIAETAPQRIRSLLLRLNLPVKLPPELTPEKIRELILVDKKVKDGKVNLVLLQAIGEALVTSQYDDVLLTETLSDFAADKNP